MFAKLAEKFAEWMGERTEFGVSSGTEDIPLIEENLDYQSLNRILPYDGYDPDSNIFYNKKSQGFVLETYPMLGASEENVNILTSLITDVLPQEVDLQFILWGSPKIGEWLDQFEERRRGGGEIFEWLAKKRTDYLKQGVFNSLSTSGSFHLRDFRLFVVASIEKSEREETKNTLITLRDDMINSFKSINLPSKVIIADELINILSDMLHPTTSVYPTKHRWDQYTSISQQLVDPESFIRVYSDKLSIENNNEVWEARALSVKEYPQTAAQWKMTDAIGHLFNTSLQISSPFVTTLSIRLIDHEKAVFKSQMKTINKEKTARSPLAKFMPRISKEHHDWAFVQSRIAEGDKLVQTYFQVIVFAKGNEGNAAERKVRDLYRANGWRLKKTLYLQLQSYLAMLPMMMTEGLYNDMKLLGRLHTMTAFNAMNIAPLQGEWKGTKTASLLLPGRRGQLALWHPMDNEGGNYNIAITAAPGKGKSVLVSEMIVATLGAKGLVNVIDQGHSQQKTCKLLHGEFIEFKPGSLICLNPFSTITNLNQSILMLKPIIANMARPLRGVTEEEMSYIEQAIKGAYEWEGNESTIKTVSKWLAERPSDIAKNLSHLLYSYTEGTNAAIYEGKCSIDFSNPFIVWELLQLKSNKELRSNVLQLLIYQISEKMYQGNRSQIKSCIIDEAWDLFDDDNSVAAKFIEAGYRTARKFNGNFISIAHSIADFHKNPMSRAAFDCSDYKIILGQTDEAINKLKEGNLMALDGYTERLLKSLRITQDYSEFVIKSPDGLSLHRLVLDPFSRILFSTKGEEFDAVERLQKEGYSLIQAIEIVASKFSKGISHAA